MAFLSVILSLGFLASMVRGHSVGVCFSIDGNDVTFYAANPHVEDVQVGGMVIGGATHDFTGVVDNDGSRPAGVDTSSLTCHFCDASFEIEYWETVTVTGFAMGEYVATTTGHTDIDMPLCDHDLAIGVTAEGECSDGITQCSYSNCYGDDNDLCENKYDWGCEACSTADDTSLFMKSHQYPCVQCSVLTGCSACYDWQGCIECDDKYEWYWSAECGIGMCK